jgi:nicotinamide-nucleotide amidase
VTAEKSPLDRLSEVAAERGLRICVVESLTSGRLASTIGAGENAGGWFAGGIVAYLTDIKESLLGLTPGTDPCSAECAEHLAESARRLFDADVCISTTGVGGPDPEGGHDPGTVFVGWATDDGVGHRMLALTGGPQEVLDETVDTAMRLLAFHAEGIRPAGPRRSGTASSSASAS